MYLLSIIIIITNGSIIIIIINSKSNLVYLCIEIVLLVFFIARIQFILLYDAKHAHMETHTHTHTFMLQFFVGYREIELMSLGDVLLLYQHVSRQDESWLA